MRFKKTSPPPDSVLKGGVFVFRGKNTAFG